MKYRSDFVTNSSSSSFMVAKKGELNEKQKEKIVEYIEGKFLGRKVDSLNDIGDYYRKDGEIAKEGMEAMNNGFEVYAGCIDFEIPDDQSEIYSEIWKILEKYSDGNFKSIDTDLSY